MPSDPEELERKSRKVWQAAKFASVGLELGLSVAVGALIGNWLDGRFGFTPWGVLVGTLLGVAAGVRTLIRAGREAGKADERDPPA